MNSSSHPTFPYDSSPFMSFSAIEPNGTISTLPTQKNQLLDWEYTTPHSSFPFPSYTNTTTANHFDNIPLPIYFPQPPLPPVVAEYPRAGGHFKFEDEVAVTNGAFGGLGGDRIGLNLGRRTYFSYYDHQQLLLFGRGAHHQPPRCQAEGCNADLSGAKHYHRRHKVCDFHSKAAAVFFPGRVQQRFCQQCSRFHRLAEFDGTKRSCRKRLAEHNRRRRKLQPQPSMKNNASPPLSLPPNTMPKERGKLLISPTKETSIMKSNTTGENIPAKMAVETGQYPGGSALSLGGRNGGSTFVSPERFQSHCASPCSSSNAFFHHHNLGSHSTGGGGLEMTQHNQNSVLQLGQAMFEWDFI